MTQPIDPSVLDELQVASPDKNFDGQNVGQLIEFVRFNNIQVPAWGEINRVISDTVVKLEAAPSKNSNR